MTNVPIALLTTRWPMALLHCCSVRFWQRYDIVGWVGDGQLLVRDVQTAQKHTFHAIDAVVATIGSIGVSSLAREFRAHNPDLYVIGATPTCRRPSNTRRTGAA